MFYLKQINKSRNKLSRAINFVNSSYIDITKAIHKIRFLVRIEWSFLNAANDTVNFSDYGIFAWTFFFLHARFPGRFSGRNSDSKNLNKKYHDF